MCKRMSGLRMAVAFIIMAWQYSANAMESANYQMQRSAVNAAGNTYTGSSKQIYDSVGEGVAGQSWGDAYSVQTGLFTDYFMSAPTPTPQPTAVPTTVSDLSDFEGKIISKNYIYAAPNPIQGSTAKIYVYCKQRATGKIKIFTLLGQEVLSIERSFQVGRNVENIYMGNLANAMYYLYVRVRNDEGYEEKAKTKIILLK